MDECASDNECHVNAQCTNTDGSYTCGCLDGYAGDGKICTGGRLCAVFSEWPFVTLLFFVTFAFLFVILMFTSTASSYRRLSFNFKMVKQLCNLSSLGLPDVDECVSEKACHVNAECTNTDGSYTCGCVDGYAGDGKNCTGKRLCSAVVRSVISLLFCEVMLSL